MISSSKTWQRQTLTNDQSIAQKVAQLLQQIKQQGDIKIDNLSQQFDGFDPSFIALKAFNEYKLAPKLADAIKMAAKRIEQFAEFQMQGLESRYFEDDYGLYGQNVAPLERVGAYIPGGRFPLISTALMTLIPAKVAGCKVRIACSPSDDPAILAAASLAGATQFIKIGGVQAIGALTYGYEKLTSVNLIVGPGNAWVNEAKKQVQSQTKIDGLAGPSELLAICDDQQPVEWLALDALAQAEHDPMAQSIVVSDNKTWLENMLSFLQSNEEGQTLLNNKQIELIYAESINEIINFSENYAPEHLMLCHKNINEDQLTNYGSLFVGANSAVALGDYISGPNHTLPTLQFAKQNGGLCVHDFLKVTTVQNINNFGRKILAEQAEEIAIAEGLTFHAKSLNVRR